MIIDFDFPKSIPREVLNNYLSRAVSHTSLLDTQEGQTDTLEDDLRMLKNEGAKFIGRAAYVWSVVDDAEHFKKCRERAELCHKYDPEFILQCCVFECVYKDFCENTPVPKWVFEAFGQPVENRCFSLEKMSFPDKRFDDHWGKNTGVPNIMSLEGQMWIYYRACMYINCGIEAIHFGQVWLIGALDKNYEMWQKLVLKVREYAKTHARRGYVICDAHCHGIIAPDNQSVFDFNSFPIRLREVMQAPDGFAATGAVGDAHPGVPPAKGEPMRCVVEEGYSDSIWGKNKGGVPFLVEFDNFGVSKSPGQFTPDLNNIFAWGYDEITWFSLQPDEYRAEFLRYINAWVNSRYPEGWVQMPSRRMTTFLGEAGERKRG
ncbi:MAG: hypothetical protein FWD23_15360, partial [Oscillospiraceae bacterium]|nr:hypothetical protein [Oscillospiraceae bacterium]